MLWFMLLLDLLILVISGLVLPDTSCTVENFLRHHYISQNPVFFGRALTAIIMYYKQASIWYLLHTVYHDLTWHCYSSHFGAYICDSESFRTICVIRDTLVDLCLEPCMHATLWFDENIYICIWELESLFSISALVATRTKKCTYIYNRKS